MSSILAGLDNQILLEQRTYKLWENAGHKIVEAQLTADQIKQLFANVEQGATDAGGNRTLIGKGKDAAGAVNTAWEDLKSKVYNSGPMNNFAAAYDKQAEKLKQATGGDQGVFKYVQKYRDFAEKHPIIQGFVYAALIAAAGVTGAGLGGAAVLGLFKLTDQLLQGKDIRSAIYQGAKTGALAYGASKLGDLVTGRNTPVTAKSSKTTWDAVDQGFVKPQGAGGGLPGGGTTSGGETWSATLRGITGDQIINHPDYATYIQKYGDTVNGRKMAQAMVKNAIAKGQAMAGQGTYNVTNEGIELNEATIKILLSKVSLEHSKRIDEGIMDTLKGAAGKAMDYAKTKGHNLTTKITADKLNTAWEKAGKPNDSDQIATILKSTGVPEDVVKNVFAQMKIPVAAAPAAGQQPA
ncbi:hypothetical protein FJ365_06260, partial [Candidatus Dependentiae bacterium]|nr:hypothetical protein [Candidatus Dependentiae bacterium]